MTLSDSLSPRASLLPPPLELQRMLRQAEADAEGFEYAIAHDLRTPLRAVAASAGILLEELGPSLDAAHRDLLERQARNATRFGCLIDDLLELSRLNRARVRRQSVALAALVRRLAPAARLDEGGFVCGDPALVERALACLLDNARKFSAGGPVDVRQSGNAVTVVDYGVGFDPAHAARIFRPFERLVGDEFPGTGIGLTLVERIARLHDGGVHVTASPRRGAAFTIDFGG